MHVLPVGNKPTPQMTPNQVRQWLPVWILAAIYGSILGVIAAPKYANAQTTQRTVTSVVVTLSDGTTQTVNAAPATQPTKPATQPFATAGAKIIDGNGAPFIFEGFNIPVAWGGYAPNAAGEAKKARANAARFCFGSDYALKDNAPDRRAAIVAIAIRDGIVPLVCDGFTSEPGEQTTGQTDPAPLRAAVARWCDPLNAAWLKVNPVVCIEPANEWGPEPTNGNTVWRDEYKLAIAQIRSAGIVNAICINTGNWGQSPLNLEAYAKDVMASDPLGRTFFDIHIYNQWRTEERAADLAKYPGKVWDVKTELAKLQAAGIPFIIGEFSATKFKDSRTDTPTLLRHLDELDIGWCAWSWNQNADSNADMLMRKDAAGNPAFTGSVAWEYKDDTWLKEFGKLVILDPQYGLKATAKKATVFP